MPVEEEFGCPVCGSINIIEADLGDPDALNVCATCGHSWPVGDSYHPYDDDYDDDDDDDSTY